MNVTGCSSLCVKDDNPDIFMGFELCLVVECLVFCCCCCNTYLLVVTLHDTAEMVRADHFHLHPLRREEVEPMKA